MPYDNIPGAFGSNQNREHNYPIDDISNRNNVRRGVAQSNFDFRSITPERWVDIICASFIIVFLIVVICTWSSFSDALFENILFPVIYIGSKIVAIVTAIGTGIGILCAKFRRRRYWW